jgi:hypothetical protein
MSFPTHKHLATGDIVFWRDDMDPTAYALLPANYWPDRQAAEAMVGLRNKRDELIAKTDWTQMPDQKPTVAAAWKAYRKALRDLPATTIDPLNPVWPVSPTDVAT